MVGQHEHNEQCHHQHRHHQNFQEIGLDAVPYSEHTGRVLHHQVPVKIAELPEHIHRAALLDAAAAHGANLLHQGLLHHLLPQQLAFRTGQGNALAVYQEAVLVRCPLYAE